MPLIDFRPIALSCLLAIAIAVGLVAASSVQAQAPLGGEVFYSALLSGDQVVPPVVSAGDGEFTASGEEGGDSIDFELRVDGAGITQIHIHLGGPDENGGVAAFLFGPADPPQDGVKVSGTLTAASLIGDVAGDWDAFVMALFSGAYVQVHTVDHPAGEVRGQIFVALTTTGEEPTVEPTEEPIPVEPPGEGGGVSPASVGAFLDALDAAGFPLILQEIAVIQPWIPVPSAGILVLDGARAEVYSLSALQAEVAIANISGEQAAFQPPANATIWRATELIVILLDAPNQSGVELTLSGVLGSPVLATIAGGGLPPATGTDGGVVEEPTVDESSGSPGALPATGSGGLVGDQGSDPRTALTALLAALVAVVGLVAVLTVARSR